jgi:2-polyprenyl-3-methyl-5-hydroxy-6-metoxy-1,4-benzoquinol methylase
MHNPLNIISVEQQRPSNDQPKSSLLRERKIKATAKYERLWKVDPEQFNPLRNCMERERLNRTLDLLATHINLKGTLIADLGCGGGEFSRRMRDGGAEVHAVDVAENALKVLREHNFHNIKTIQDYVPRTLLSDSTYNGVSVLELIAELPSDEYRMLFSEIARLMKRDGFVLFSTPVDYRSDDAIERLAMIAETELKILEWRFSYHALYLRLKGFIESPKNFVKGWKDKNLRNKRIEERKGLSRFWYRINTSAILGPLWVPIELLFKPLVYLFRQNRSLLLSLEKVCRFLSDRAGISHVIFIALRKPIMVPNVAPVQERPKKREVWE